MLAFIVFWGLNFVAMKFVLAEWTPKTTMLLRYLAMVPLLYALCAVVRQTAKIPKGMVLRYLLAGFVHSGLYMVLFVEGMDHIGPAQGAVCLVTAPIWIVLLNTLFGHEKTSPGVYVAMVVAYFGVAAVILGGEQGVSWTAIGVTLILASAVLWAVGVVLMRPLLQGQPALGVLTASMPGAAFVLVPYAALDLANTDFSKVTPLGWGSMAYLIVLAGVVGFGAYFYAVEKLGPGRVAASQYFVPVVAAIGGWAIMGKALNAVQIAGIAVVLAAVALAQRSRTTPPTAAEAAPAD